MTQKIEKITWVLFLALVATGIGYLCYEIYGKTVYISAHGKPLTPLCVVCGRPATCAKPGTVNAVYCGDCLIAHDREFSSRPRFGNHPRVKLKPIKELDHYEDMMKLEAETEEWFRENAERRKREAEKEASLTNQEIERD